MIKALIPKWIKLYLKLTLRSFIDVKKGYLFKFSKKGKSLPNYTFQINQTQDLKKSSSLEAKIFNLNKAASIVKQYQIQSNEIFSFWKAIGNPSEKRDYKAGRTIIDGELSESIGGGLCQLSGLIYLLSLEAGLTILERHNHSLDLYTESSRYAPLGSDATVVFGYKDLRIKNPYPFSIYFDFKIESKKITAFLYSKEEIKKTTVTFKVVEQNERVKKVITYINERPSTTSNYKIPKPTT